MYKMCNYILLLCAVITVKATQDAQHKFKLDEIQFHNMSDGTTIQEGNLWLTEDDHSLINVYRPDEQNQYHLFTRRNPSASQVLTLCNDSTILNSYFCPKRPTVVLIHGWQNNAKSDFQAAVVPAYLAAKDVNVIDVDWSAGAMTLYSIAVFNTVTSGESVARFIRWLNSVTGADLANYHIVGHSLGAHQAGVVGRNLGGEVSYITALDPARPGWIINVNKFRADDGIYTEVIHTNAGTFGLKLPLGDVDFYPNGGRNMPGCTGNFKDVCNHERAFYYFAESVASSGFVGRGCSSYHDALNGECDLPERLNMGGICPKTGCRGIYYLETNAEPPYSKNKEENKLC